MSFAKMLRTSVVVLTAALLGMQAGELRAEDRKPRVTAGEAGFTVHGVPSGELASEKDVRVFGGYGGRVSSVAFSPDGRQALSGDSTNTVNLWDVESGKELRVFRGYMEEVYSVAFSPDGRQALSGGSNSTLNLWDVESGKELRVFRGYMEEVYSVAFSPDGKQALSGSSNSAVKLWDVESGEELRAFWGHAKGIRSVAFSPDGSRVLSGSGDGTLRLWDVASGKEPHVFRGHKGAVYSVAFSPDGRQVLSGSEDKTSRLWDVASGKELRIFRVPWSSVLSVAFSPNGRQVLSGSADGTLRLWDVASGRELRVFRGGRNPSVAFSPNGRQVLSGSRFDRLRLWNIVTEPPPGHLSRDQFRKAVQKKAAEELRRLQNELVGPIVSRPQLPPRQVHQDPFESKSMFKERVARADAEWNMEATGIQEKYRAEVNARNVRVERFRENLRSHQWNAYSHALVEVQGHPILTVMEDEAGRPKYDPEQGHLHLAFRFEHAMETEDWVFKVLAGDPVRALYQALKYGKARASVEYSTQGDSAALVSVVAHHGNRSYRGKPALADFNAPERRSVEIGVNADGLPDLEQQDPDLNWEIPKTVHSRFSDDIPGLLSKARAAPVDNRKWLFVIGIEDYPDDAADDILYSRRTTRKFIEVAQKTLGIPETHVKALIEGDASGLNIKHRLERLLRDVGEGDTVYLYYSGHGVPAAAKGNAAFILPQDALPEAVTKSEDYRVDNIYKKLLASRASRIFAFMDSCFTGETDGKGVFRGRAATRLVPKKFEISEDGKIAVLTAGTGEQSSNAYKEKGYRLFSYFLMRALIDGHTGNIGNLHEKVHADVRHQTIRRMGGGEYTQEPVLQGNPRLGL